MHRPIKRLTTSKGKIDILAQCVDTFMILRKEIPIPASNREQNSQISPQTGCVLSAAPINRSLEKEADASSRVSLSFRRNGVTEKSCPSQTQGVAHYRYGAKCHGGCGELRVEKNSEKRIQRARGNRNAENVIDKSPEEVLPDHLYCLLGKPDRHRDGAQVILDKGNIACFYRHVRAGADGNPYIRRCQSGRI